MNAPPPIPAKPLPATRPRPWLGFVLDGLIAIVVLIATVLIGTMAWGFFAAVRIGMHDPQAAADPNALTRALGEPPVVMMMLVSSLGMLLAALVVYLWRRRATPAERSASRAAATQPRTWIEAIGLGIALSIGSALLMSALEQAGHTPNPTNLEFLEAILAYSPALLVLVAVVIAPISEELLFRRCLFGRLWAVGKPGAGMIASSLLFAFSHEVPGTTDSPWAMTLVLLLFYTAMGASLAWIYRRTGTLWAPIATHATNNLIGCAMMIAGYGS